MGISRLLGLCAALLFASSVTAANIIDLGPSDYRSWGSGSYQHRPGGIGSSFGQGARLSPTLGTLTVTRNPVIPYGSVVNGMKNFVRINPTSAAASAAITAAFLAMDWYFDQDSGEWVKGQEEFVEYSPPVSGGWSSSQGGVFTHAEAACLSTDGCTNYGACNPVVISTTPYFNGHCRGPDGVARGTFSPADPVCPAGTVYTPLGCALYEYQSMPLTGADWQALEGEIVTMPPAIAGNSADDVMKRSGQIPGYHDTAMTGPSSVSGPETTSTSTDPVSGDTTVTNTSTTTNISYGDTTITTTNTTTTTTYQNGQETSTTVTTETPGELPVTDSGTVPAGDWPGFCDWATVVCDWLNWTQEEPPPDVDLPQIIDDDFYNEKTISFGAKSCPPDYEINLTPFMETTVGVSFQPLCDFAGLIYYMVMAASYIIAAYISIGVARNG